MKFTHKGSNYELTTRKAPNDTNGNVRIDIISTKDGETYRPTIKGFRKIKVGYRVQVASHHYSSEVALNDLKAELVSLDPVGEVSLTAAEPRSSMHKDTKALIREHIIANMSDDDAPRVSDKLLRVVNGFGNWYGQYEQRKTPNVQNAFAEWLTGLPSELYATPYYEEQRELLNEWLGATYKNYTDEVVSHRFYALIFREFNKLCHIYKVADVYKRINI